MHNIICIDPSLSCTAVVVNDQKFAFVKQDLAFTKTMKLGKWFDIVSGHVELRYHTGTNKKMDYAETERWKVESYDLVTENIADHIRQHIDPKLPSKVYIEGYSFSSAAGPLIDLVTFGTLLRAKLYWTVSRDITVIAPSELKLLAAKFTYPMTLEGKKQVWRNNEGVSGGSFKKHDMYKALAENTTLNDAWVKLLREHGPEIMAAKAIPKPIEDLNDAKLMYEVAKANKY